MLDQVAIFTLGAAAVTFTNLKSDRLRRWAPICGLMAEPFWLYTGWTHGQWGIVGLAIIYIAAWSMGAYNHWFNPPDSSSSSSSSSPSSP